MNFTSLREKLGERMNLLYKDLVKNLSRSNMDSYELRRLLLDIINHIDTIDNKIKQIELKENFDKINKQYDGSRT